MLTLNAMLNRYCKSNVLTFEGTHYREEVPVYSGDLWRLFPREDESLPTRRLNRLQEICERKGVQLRFYDEITRDDNGRVHETIPGFHGQTPTFQVVGEDCEVWAQDEALDNQSRYIDSLLTTEAPATRWSLDFEKHGFKRFDYEAESGFHHGQTDTPESVRAMVEAKHGECEIIFHIGDVGQFDLHFVAWYRKGEAE